MSEVTLRRAVPGDEKVLACIQTESWKAAFSAILSAGELERSTNLERAEEMYRKVLDQHKAELVIEFVDKQPHCIAGWSRNRNGLGEAAAELICIHSLCDKWHQGYGSVMMRHVLEEMKEVGYSQAILWVFEENRRSRRFYEKHGFRLSGQKNQSHGVVEVMYAKQL